MRFRGGYNILLKGRPERSISAMPEPDVLYLPLQSRRFTFSELCVKEGEKVNGGEILAHRLGLKRDKGPVWAVRTEGVLATDRALTLTKPCTVRIISIGGSGVDEPAHIKVMSGYPVKDIKDEYVFEPDTRLIDGGVLTGQTVSEEKFGLDAECRGLTVLPDAEPQKTFSISRNSRI